MYCKKCGGKLESYASNCAFCGTPVEKYDAKANYIAPPKKQTNNSSMSVGKWLGFSLLPFIPLIGTVVYLVLVFKWAFGNHDDLTLKNYAKANLIFMLLAFVLIIGLSILIAMLMPDLLNELGTQL